MEADCCASCFEKLTFPISYCENNHSFHRSCILNWNLKNLACPVCRTKYYPPEKEDCASLRNFRNPSVEDYKKVITVNPLQIRYLDRANLSQLDYEILWLTAVTKMPSVIQQRADPPLRLRLYAIYLCPKTILNLDASFDESIYAISLDPGVAPEIISKFSNKFTLDQLAKLTVLAITNLPRNIKHFNNQFCYDYSLSLDPHNIYYFSEITFKTCLEVIDNHKNLIHYCLSRIKKPVWLDLLVVKNNLIKYYFGQDLDIVIHALRQNLSAFFYLNYLHRTSKKVIKFVLTKSKGRYIQHVSQNLITCKLAYKLNPKNLKFMTKPSKAVKKWIVSLKAAS